MPKSTTRTPSGSRRRASRRATSTPNASSPRKMLPTPATRTRGGCMPDPSWQGRNRLDFLDAEEEPVAGLAQRAPLPARVVVHSDGQVDPAFQVLFDRLD